MNRENISSFGDEHSTWLKALDFYKQELAIIRERLTEIAGKNTAKEASAEIEHFENQLKVQTENIDILHHDINENLTKSAHEAKGNSAGYIDASLFKTHDNQRESFNTTEAIINDLRKEFNLFAAKWM